MHWGGHRHNNHKVEVTQGPWRTGAWGVRDGFWKQVLFKVLIVEWEMTETLGVENSVPNR